MAQISAKQVPTTTTTSGRRVPVRKSHSCEICQRSFGSAYALSDHRSATKHYPAHCPICNKGFGSREAVNQHAQVHLGAVLPQFIPDTSTRRTEEATIVLAETMGNIHLGDSNQLLSPQVPVITQGTGGFNVRTEMYHQTIQDFGENQSPCRNDVFIHNLNPYTILSPHEQESVYASLLAACHSPMQLHEESYTMPGRSKHHRKTSSNFQYSEFKQTPILPISLRVKMGKRKVVAIDCEMVGLHTGKECIAYLSAVDVLTGETILNTLVNPMGSVKDWRSRYSGVTRGIMNDAIRTGQALPGWRAARQALWEHIDGTTILVGHALYNDLNVLGIFHSRIVDSAILAAQAVFPDMQDKHFPRHWGLKKLSTLFLGLTIQRGKKGHDCLEDTLASRELVLWCMRYPDKLIAWGKRTRLEYEHRLLTAKIRNAELKMKRDNEKSAKQTQQYQMTITQAT